MERWSFKFRKSALAPPSFPSLRSLHSGGEHHTLFLLNDGSVAFCGRCDCGQSGLAPDNPLIMSIKKAVTEGQAARDQAVKDSQEEIAKKRANGEMEDMTDEEAQKTAAELGASKVVMPQEMIGNPATIPFPEEEADEARGLAAGPAKIVSISAGTR